MSVTQVIRSAMKERGVTQTGLAHRLGMPQQSLSDRLTGRVRLSFVDVVSIACELELDLGDLITASAEDVPSTPSALAATPSGAHAAAGGQA